jgi:isopentenyl diphosphate isomerase/L-lactate dehydrogenase-like FMN-dependent dehydrogenase/rubredoxin
MRVSESKYVCTFCNIFVFDKETGDRRAELAPGIELAQISPQWRCPVCGHWKGDLREISDEEFTEKRTTYEKSYPQKARRPLSDITYYRDIARRQLARICAVNKVCDGNPDRLCMGMKYGRPIGFGGTGQGKTFDANFKALAKYKLKMRVIKEHHEPEIEATFLGKKIVMPVMVTSVSGTKISMNNALSEEEFQRGMVEGAKLFGTIGLSGHTVDAPDHPGIDIIGQNGGWGIPVFKPQAQDKLLELFRRAEKADVIAIGVDLDGYGSTNWALRGKPLYRKSEKELKELVDATEKPVIYKGIMNLDDAARVVDSGAKAMDISNHGGRVMDYGQGVAEVLPEIAGEFKSKITIMADGAVRTGFDAFKLLALGANVALIGRELARMSLAGGPEAVKTYLDYVKKDLRMAMIMTCCDSLKEITKDKLVADKLDQ